MEPRPQGPTLFPYTTLFRSAGAPGCAGTDGEVRASPGLWVMSALLSAWRRSGPHVADHAVELVGGDRPALQQVDRKSTRLNSSHSSISYAVFCLKKKSK